MGVKKVYLTWDDVFNLLDIIHEQTKKEINYVTGVPRGGTLLAILYSHRYNVPYFEFKSNHYPHLLILDDIADSGETFLKLKQELDVPKYAALHYKTTSKFKPDYFGVEIPEDFGWVVYPWEREDAKPIQDYLEN